MSNGASDRACTAQTNLGFQLGRKLHREPIAAASARTICSPK